MRFFIIPNLDKPHASACTQDTVATINELGGQCCLEQTLQRVFLNLSAEFLPQEECLNQCDIILSIGGDGTIMHASTLAMVANKPILGINTGRLGFLAQLESSQLHQLKQLIEGRYTLEDRMLLKAVLYRGDEVIFTQYALNDVVISRMYLGRILDIQVCCNNHHFTNYRADGLIFSTPTGSTAYSLSAGGSIVDPAVDSILMTPICPHTLFDRPVILAPDKVLTVRTEEVNNPSAFHVAVDGEIWEGLGQGDSVEISRGETPVHFVKLEDSIDFYGVITQKMIRQAD